MAHSVSGCFNYLSSLYILYSTCKHLVGFFFGMDPNPKFGSESLLQFSDPILGLGLWSLQNDWDLSMDLHPLSASSSWPRRRKEEAFPPPRPSAVAPTASDCIWPRRGSRKRFLLHTSSWKHFLKQQEIMIQPLREKRENKTEKV